MNAKIGVSAREAVEEHIESFEKPEAIWNTAVEDEMQSDVGCEQISSESLRNSLRLVVQHFIFLT